MQDFGIDGIYYSTSVLGGYKQFQSNDNVMPKTSPGWPDGQPWRAQRCSFAKLNTNIPLSTSRMCLVEYLTKEFINFYVLWIFTLIITCF